MKNEELRLATRLKIGRRIAEAGRGKINLHEVALALGVTERTLRNWRNQAMKDVPKMGRPSHSQEVIEEAKKLVFEQMKEQGSPGWRPIAEVLKGRVSVRLVQRFVAEYKFEERNKPRLSTCTKVLGKNIIWSMDGAFTKEEGKVENQVIKDRATKCWVGFGKNPRASNADCVIATLKQSFELNGVPLVLSTDNGAAYTNRSVSTFLRNLKIIHLKSLPRTPQHNGAVEVGIRELKEIMQNKQIYLKDAIKIANARPRKYGRNWSKPISAFENSDLLYNKIDRDNFYESCVKRLRNLKNESLNYREKRLKERSLIFEELEKRNFVTQWKMTKNG